MLRLGPSVSLGSMPEEAKEESPIIKALIQSRSEEVTVILLRGWGGVQDSLEHLLMGANKTVNLLPGRHLRLRIWC